MAFMKGIRESWVKQQQPQHERRAQQWPSSKESQSQLERQQAQHEQRAQQVGYSCSDRGMKAKLRVMVWKQCAAWAEGAASGVRAQSI
eukprot:1156388-Pelagomonas_calceolata.AAC.10